MNTKERVKQELWCEALENGNTMRYRALGWSMSPFIKEGSILTIRPGKRAFIGDVILYKRADSMIAHRVIGKRRLDGRAFLVVKGDNSNYRGDLVSSPEILGKG